MSVSYRRSLTWHHLRMKAKFSIEFFPWGLKCFINPEIPLSASRDPLQVPGKLPQLQAISSSLLWISTVFHNEVKVLVGQSHPTLCDPMDCSLPGRSLHGILQARVLEWVTVSFSRGSSWPRDRTWVSRIPGRRFNLWANAFVHSEASLRTKLVEVTEFQLSYFKS